MRDPIPETTWNDFLRIRRRCLDEILVCLPSMTWWELEQARVDLARLRFEIERAEEHIDQAKVTESNT